VVTKQGQDRIVNQADGLYLTPTKKSVAQAGTSFSFEANSGDLVVAHTDGIDECHYRNPRSSVQPEHVIEIAAQQNYAPGKFVDELMGLAMRGIRGNPGGQDNIAVIATVA